MREHLYRAKREGKDEWVKGYFTNCYCARIVRANGNEYGHPIDYIDVDFNTVSEYTGLTDKNCKKIFEGDIVKLSPPDKDFSLHNPKEERILEVVFFKGMFALDMHKWWKYGHGRCALEGYESERLEVIGNIYDTPELLESTK